MENAKKTKKLNTGQKIKERIKGRRKENRLGEKETRSNKGGTEKQITKIKDREDMRMIKSGRTEVNKKNIIGEISRETARKKIAKKRKDNLLK